MSISWILVANASTARLYVNNGLKKGLKLIKEFEHPESREKASELVSDRPSAGNAHGYFVPATDPKHHEADRFASQLAKDLEHGRTANSYERLIVVASSPFLGMLNQRLNEHVNSMISDRIEKDYTRLPEKDLRQHLEHCIYL